MIEAPSLDLETVGSVAAWVDELERRFRTRETEIGAFLPEPGRFDRLRRELDALLARSPQPGERPPLFGVPIGVKDIFHVDGFDTRAGSVVPPAELAGRQAIAVSRLLAAGAVVVGKTVTTEFAYFAPRGTRNPADPRRTPGGSSSGSAAAVAAGLCEIALGTQTIGSISRPASYCGVVGFKPTYDRIPRDGVIPLAPSVDHVGLFAPTVAWAARAAAVLVDDWERVEAAPGPRLAVPVGAYLERAEAGGRRRFEAAVERLRETGTSIVEVAAFDDFDAVEARHRRLVAAEAARVHADWYPRYGGDYHRKTRELIESGLEVDEATLERDRAGRAGLRETIDRHLARAGADLWVAPASPDVAPLGLESTGDPVMNLPWSHAGLPTVTVPSPSTAGELPFGVQLAAPWGADERLLAQAADIEARLG